MKTTALILTMAMACGSMAQFYQYKEIPPPGQARVATDAAGVGVRVVQRLNETIPLDARFKDETGQDVTLERYFKKRPVIILPIFYRCPGICETELASLVNSLKGFKKAQVGKEFDVIAISIHHKEKPELAATKKENVIAAYMGSNTDTQRRVTAERGWAFLTGDEKQIRRVTDALGFEFKYDPANDTIVHPAGIMVMTPAGKISRYFVTTEYPQQVLLSAIEEAGQGQVGVRDDRPFFMACIQVDPMTGQRSLNVLNALKTLTVVTLIGFLVAVFVWNRKAKSMHQRETRP